MKVKAIIFDVDGTLVETEELHRAAFNTTFKNWNLSWEWSRSTYARLLSVSGGIERLTFYQNLTSYKNGHLTEDNLHRLHEEKTNLYIEFLAKTKLILRPGVENLIAQAQERKIKLAIATATSLKNVQALGKNIWGGPIQEIFHVIITSEDVLKKKPSPEVYQLAVAQLFIEPRHCIVIEDSINGLQSAQNAGLKTVITPSLYTLNDDFSSADLVVDSLNDFEL